MGSECRTFQELYAPPFPFPVTIGEVALRFNADMAMDLVCVGQKHVLHVMDTHTLYQNAAFIYGKLSRCLWTQCFEFWG